MSQRFFIGTDDYLIGIGPDLKDKRWVPQSQTKTLALAHRIMDDSFVSAQHFSVRRHEVSCGKILSRLLPHRILNKGSVIPVRNETDILTVRLIRHKKSDLLRYGTDLVLCVDSHRHQCVRQLLLGQIIQGVGLIFRRCGGAPDRIPPIREPVDSCIMSGGDIFRPDGHTPV